MDAASSASGRARSTLWLLVSWLISRTAERWTPPTLDLEPRAAAALQQCSQR